MITESALNKWRCLIALAWVDGEFQEEEKEFFKKSFENQQDGEISKGQMDILLQDMKETHDYQDLYKAIEDKVEKVDLMRLAYSLFWSDDEFTECEKDAYMFILRSLSEDLNTKATSILNVIRKKMPKDQFIILVQETFPDVVAA